MDFEKQRIKWAVWIFIISFLVAYHLNTLTYTRYITFICLASIALIPLTVISPFFLYPSSLVFQYVLPTSFGPMTIAITTLVGFASLAVLVSLFLKKKTEKRKLETSEIMALTLLVLLFFLTAFHNLPIAFTNYRLVHFVEGFLVFFVISRGFNSEKHLKILSWVFIITALLLSVRHYAHTSVFESGFFGFENNHISRQLGFLLFVTLGVAFAEKTKKMKAMALLAAGFTAQSMIQLGSRATYLSMGIIAIIFGISYLKKRLAWGIGFAAIFLLIVFSPPQFFEEVTSIFVDVPLAEESNDLSVVGRAFAFKEGVNLFKKRPFFGWGPGRFEPSLQEETGVYLNAHNSYIEFLVGWGLFAFLIYIGMFLISMYYLIKGMKITKFTNKYLYEINKATLFGVVTLTINQLFINGPWDPVVWTAFGFSTFMYFLSKKSKINKSYDFHYTLTINKIHDGKIGKDTKKYLNKKDKKPVHKKRRKINNKKHKKRSK